MIPRYFKNDCSDEFREQWNQEDPHWFPDPEEFEPLPEEDVEPLGDDVPF